MAEQQAVHRRSLEAQITEAQVNDIQAARVERRIGQILGIVAVLVALVVAALVGTIGRGPWAASVISGVQLTGLVVAFIAGRSKPENGKTDGKK